MPHSCPASSPPSEIVSVSPDPALKPPLDHDQPFKLSASPSLSPDIFSITDDELAAQYTFQREIGFGNWGSIWQVSTSPSPSYSKPKTLAIKLVHRDKSSNTTTARVKSLWGEFKILRRFKKDPSPHVLRISSFIITPSYALLTMAFHPSLLPVRLGESHSKTARYLRGLVSGVDFLHRHHITHNDIKPANVVLSADDQAVLIDFGFAVSYGSDWDDEGKGQKKYWSQLSWGTPEYLSPQRAKAEPHDERLSDIWSLGITLYEVVIGRTPFEMDDHEEFLSTEALEVYYQRTLTGQFQGIYTLSHTLSHLLKSMIHPDPLLRLSSCARALVHPYFLQNPAPRLALVGGASVQDRLRAFEPSKPSKITRPPPTSALNKHLNHFTLAKPPSSSTLRVYRDEMEPPAASPVKARAMVLTDQDVNTPPRPPALKRVPVPKLVEDQKPTVTRSKFAVEVQSRLTTYVANSEQENSQFKAQKMTALGTNSVEQAKRPSTDKSVAAVAPSEERESFIVGNKMTPKVRTGRIYSGATSARKFACSPTPPRPATATRKLSSKSARSPTSVRPTTATRRLDSSKSPRLSTPHPSTNAITPIVRTTPLVPSSIGVCNGPARRVQSAERKRSSAKTGSGTTPKPRLMDNDNLNIRSRVPKSAPTTRVSRTRSISGPGPTASVYEPKRLFKGQVPIAKTSVKPAVVVPVSHSGRHSILKVRPNLSTSALAPRARSCVIGPSTMLH